MTLTLSSPPGLLQGKGSDESFSPDSGAVAAGFGLEKSPGEKVVSPIPTPLNGGLRVPVSCRCCCAVSGSVDLVLGEAARVEGVVGNSVVTPAAGGVVVVVGDSGEEEEEEGVDEGL